MSVSLAQLNYSLFALLFILYKFCVISLSSVHCGQIRLLEGTKLIEQEAWAELSQQNVSGIKLHIHLPT